MADMGFRTPNIASPAPAILAAHPETPWGSIWAGVFTVAAIWSVFGLLGAAIFDVSAHGSVSPWGMGIWSIVLTMIAMYVGGRVTSRLANLQERGDRITCGMAMFGLSTVSAAILVILAGAASGSSSAMVSGPYLASVITTVGWFGFIALFLGWLCAIAGATTAGRTFVRETATVHDIRNAA